MAQKIAFYVFTPYIVIVVFVILVIFLIFLYFQQDRGALITKVKEAIGNLVGSEVVSLMTYSEAIQYFVEQRQSHPELFKKGAMLLEKSSQDYLFVQVFLAEKNELVCQSDGKPYGRKLTANQLDDELLQAFGQKSLVIVE